MLYFITNRKLVTKDKFINVVGEAIASGIDRIILREKDLKDDQLLLLARAIQELIAGYDECKLIINSNINVAKEINAFGLHLPYGQFINYDKSFIGEIGVSVHSLEEAVEACKKGASYILAGHIFETKCKEGLRPRGIEFIREMKSMVKIPVIALGGIYPDNAKLVLDAGADGIAVMSTVMTSKNIKNIVHQYKEVYL
ncbi:MAG: thiamine phosphate synthase [Clostridiaceae bacterium]